MIRACQKFCAACPTTFSFQIIFGTSSTNQSEDGKIFGGYLQDIQIQMLARYKFLKYTNQCEHELDFISYNPSKNENLKTRTGLEAKSWRKQIVSIKELENQFHLLRNQLLHLFMMK